MRISKNLRQEVTSQLAMYARPHLLTYLHQLMHLKLTDVVGTLDCAFIVRQPFMMSPVIVLLYKCAT
jgi:hypothetical protein